MSGHWHGLTLNYLCHLSLAQAASISMCKLFFLGFWLQAFTVRLCFIGAVTNLSHYALIISAKVQARTWNGLGRK